MFKGKLIKRKISIGRRERVTKEERHTQRYSYWYKSQGMITGGAEVLWKKIFLVKDLEDVRAQHVG